MFSVMCENNIAISPSKKLGIFGSLIVTETEKGPCHLHWLVEFGKRNEPSEQYSEKHSGLLKNLHASKFSDLQGLLCLNMTRSARLVTALGLPAMLGEM